MTFQDSSFLIVSKTSIDRFQSRGQQLCKFLGIIESFNMRIKFKSHRIFFVHKHASRRDVRWKRSIENFRFKDEDNYQDKISLKFFSRIFRKQTAREASLSHFFTRKAKAFTFLKEIFCILNVTDAQLIVQAH